MPGCWWPGWRWPAWQWAGSVTGLAAGVRMRCFSAGSRSRATRSRRAGPWWVLLLVALTGTLSTDVVDNGPATTLEQAMLAAEDAGTAAVYGRYNMVGAAAGALGSLAVTLPGLGRGGTAPDGRLFAVLVPVGVAGVLVALRLSP